MKRVEGQTGSRKLVKFYSNLGGIVLGSDIRIQREIGKDLPHKKMSAELNDNELTIKMNQVLTKQSKKYNLKLSL